MTSSHPIPSPGERALQAHLATQERADAFYSRQVHQALTPPMRDFIGRQSMVFLSTADRAGHCDASFRAGPPGFVTVLDDGTLTYPEYRGNGVLASAGNIAENPHIGLLFMDFTQHHIGLHINGTAALLAADDPLAAHARIPADLAPGRKPELWIRITVQEAYVHCSKHIPHLEPAARPRRRQPDQRPKDSEYFIAPAPAQPSAVPFAPEPHHYPPMPQQVPHY
ncbi:pyridoxamine 5'-phosphate oxidase family protein [Streptomyces sp. ASQP_92]|uniref:pyridoxamine 5'-phosphate oxidase family protein n=1 Tax=Streptomyces sp. ASQP_92 TaxID=2979116 RepID=UPI0021BEBD73|nr:pyridoxamine 5'-phosphate oxidase family protein [Streptomyces sp. ASQP_92]MCT9094332.1 pyridoxamine 5'-phosphate oxidase family protein [Streptomyces sp. ASQP_92]